MSVRRRTSVEEVLQSHSGAKLVGMRSDYWRAETTMARCESQRVPEVHVFSMRCGVQ